VHSIEVDGLRTTYEREGSGPPVVLVHGYVGDGRSTWLPQLDELTDEFDVIAWDLPGAGGSDDPPESFGMSGFAEALAGLVAGLHLADPHLVGLSFGAALIIELCRRHQRVPASITLVGGYAGWGGSLPPIEVERRLDQALDLSRLPPNELVDALLPTMFAPSAPPDVIAGFEESLSSFHPAGLRAMARACTADLRDVVPTIRLPTLLVYGEEDARAPAEVATTLHSAIAGSELVVLPGAGHVCNVDAATSFNATLRRFLSEHPSSN
jgi:pimeloyl-ACP methyl ester carboxylesterase